MDKRKYEYRKDEWIRVDEAREKKLEFAFAKNPLEIYQWAVSVFGGIKTQNIGSCNVCEAATSSGMNRLCRSCAHQALRIASHFVALGINAAKL